MPDTPNRSTIVIMWAASAVLLAAGVIAAISTDDDSDEVEAATTTTVGPVDTDTGPGADSDTDENSPATSTPSTAPPSTAPADDSTGRSSTTAAPASTTSSPPTTTASSTTAPSTSEPAPTEPGAFSYDTDGTMTLGTAERDLPEVTTLEVRAPDAEGRQVQVRDLRDESGDGSVTTTTFRLAPEGVYLEQIELAASFGGFGQTSTMTATQPFLVVPPDAETGTVTTGRLEGDGIVAEVTFTVTAVGADTTSSRIETVLSGDIEGTQVSDQVSRSSDRLLLSEDVDSDVNSGGVRVQTQYTATKR